MPTERTGASERPDGGTSEQQRYVALLERLLAVQAATVAEALDQAAQLVVVALAADKVDAFVYDAGREALVAVGVSATPMGQRERALGLDVLPLRGGGRTVEVFQTGVPYATGHADQDPQQLPSFTQELGIRSMLIVPLEVTTERRGVLAVDAAQPAAFSAADLPFIQAVARWLGLVAHRVEADAARRAAETSVRVRDDFLAAATHDLRGPLTILRGRAQLMWRRLEPEHADALDLAWLRTQIDAVCAATGRMLAMVEEIADVARLQIGQTLDLHREAVDLGALVRATVVEARSGQEQEQEEQTPITVEVPPEPVVVEGDRARLQRVLHNVLTNALKFSPAHTPVHVAVRAGEGWVTITVADQGVGIPRADVPRLFTRFYRASTAVGVPGSGLGLWGAKAIVEQHGGTITLESSVGHGTTVMIALPRRPPGAPGPDAGPVGPPPPGCGATGRRQQRR